MAGMTEEKRQARSAALNTMRYLNMKPIYSTLSRQYVVSRKTIKKYNTGFTPSKTKKRRSILDPHYDEIKEKLALSGATITGV